MLAKFRKWWIARRTPMPIGEETYEEVSARRRAENNAQLEEARRQCIAEGYEVAPLPGWRST